MKQVLFFSLLCALFIPNKEIVAQADQGFWGSTSLKTFTETTPTYTLVDNNRVGESPLLLQTSSLRLPTQKKSFSQTYALEKTDWFGYPQKIDLGERSIEMGFNYLFWKIKKH